MKTKLLLAALLLPLAAAAPAASVSEPATVFYGKVINQSGAIAQVLKEGELVWTISGAAGNEDITLRTSLADYGNGQYSYRLDVPHQVLALGLQPASGTIPVAAKESTHRHLEIKVNDRAASIKTPGQYQFDIGAVRRAATHRLDLIVTVPAEDSDGDGMPDWWEDEQGLDKQSNDANSDLDGDGISNLDEFLRGLSASHDNRGPQLLTSDVFAYSGAKSGVPLRTYDLDSGPEQLTYTLVATPGVGTLLLRNDKEDPFGPDRELEPGARFTQADVDGGRLIYRVEDEAADPSTTSFSVSVRDEDPDHEASAGAIEVNLFVPPEGLLSEEVLAAALLPEPLPKIDAGGQAPARNAALGREHGYVLWDLSGQAASFKFAQPSSDLTSEDYREEYLQKFGEAVPHAITGGSGADELAGGMKADLISGGAGDDQLRGGGGRDRFVMRDRADGNDTVLDFQLGPEGDALDISSILEGSSSSLTDYVELRDAESGLLIGIDTDGDGSGFRDMVIRLSGLRRDGTDLYRMIEEGNLLAGSLQLPPLVEISATGAEARENNRIAGEFTIRRAGSTEEAVTINLLLAGTAENGIDYSRISPSVTIPAGQASIAVAVIPFADTRFEVTEVVELSLLAGTGYQVGSDASAQVVIHDLKPELRLSVLTPRAEVSGGVEGVIMIQRSEVVDRSVLVRLEAAGTATAGTDYERLPGFVEMPAGETFRLIRIVPKAAAQLSGGAETVNVSLLDDPSYLPIAPRSARVTIVPELIDLAAWRARHFAGTPGDLEAFASGDSGNQGLDHLLRYAFALNPTHPLQNAAGSRPTVFWSEGRLALRFRENPAATDLEYKIESSDDLRTWKAAENSELEDLTPSDAAAGVRIYRPATPGGPAPKLRFLRVRVVRQAP